MSVEPTQQAAVEVLPCRLTTLPAPRRWLYRGIALGMAAIGCELILQVTALISPVARIALARPSQRAALPSPGVPSVLTDDLLGYRGNPAFPTHDSLGYPNRRVPASVEIVAIGDSQTYGAVGKPERAWPAALHAQVGASVYNMSFGGWGPIQYRDVLDKALAFTPTTIIVGVYFGNDLYDAYHSVYQRNQHLELRTPGALAAIEEVERNGPVIDATKTLVMSQPRKDAKPAPQGVIARCRLGLSEHSKLYGASRWIMDQGSALLFPVATMAADREQRWLRQLAWANRHPDLGQAFEHGRFRTIVASPYRNLVLDLSDPRIAEGLAITRRVLELCDRRCEEAGVSFAVVLIPTKETVFSALADDQDAHGRLAGLVANEARVRRQLCESLEQLGITHIDALGHLQDCFRRTNQPYPVTRDGHPNADGHRAIARAAAETLANGHRQSSP